MNLIRFFFQESINIWNSYEIFLVNSFSVLLEILSAFHSGNYLLSNILSAIPLTFDVAIPTGYYLGIPLTIFNELWSICKFCWWILWKFALHFFLRFFWVNYDITFEYSFGFCFGIASSNFVISLAVLPAIPLENFNTILFGITSAISFENLIGCCFFFLRIAFFSKKLLKDLPIKLPRWIPKTKAIVRGIPNTFAEEFR